MTSSFLKVATCCVAAAISVSAHAQDSMTNTEASSVQLALDRGQLLYAYDQAAWHATDAMVAAAKANGAFDRIMSNGGGYVIEGDTSRQTVTFFDRSALPKVLFRAEMTNAGRTVASSGLSSGSEPITANQVRLAAERQAVLKAAASQNLGLCAQANPNVTVLPGSGGRSDVAYVMTPQTTNNAWPMGGHYRFDFQGDQPSQNRPFAKSCISLTPSSTGKGKPSGLVITHVLDDTPTEIHVFTMFASDLPIYVMTTRTKKIWVVEASGGQARIRLISSQDKK